VSPVREQYEAAEPEPEIQPEESAVEIQTLEQTIAFEEPVAAEREPPVSSEPPEIPSRNGEPEHATITQQEKSVPWTEEKELIEKSVAPPKQEVLQFEPVTRGRFEKSEPTIIEGEDLDVPTYLRKHIKVK
jgi:cell division protein FtsZ